MLSLFVGCKEKVDFEKTEFSIVEKKNLEIMDLGRSVNRAFDLLAVSDFLIVSDPDNAYHFKTFDMATGRMIGQFGKIGDGPCEFRFPSSLQRLINEDGKVGINNRHSFRYGEIKLSNDADSLTWACEELEGKFDFNYQRFVRFAEDKFVGTGLFDKRYSVSSLPNHEITDSFGSYPFVDQSQKIDYQILAMAYQGDLILHPSLPWVLSTTFDGYNFDILKFEGSGKLADLIQKHFWPALFEGENGSIIQATMKPENRIGCLSAGVSEKHIYLLFSGKTVDEGGNESKTVLVFDWDGNPIKAIELDKPLRLITVSQDDKFLFGYYDDGKANIYRAVLR
jgi:hypothetical protein